MNDQEVCEIISLVQQFRPAAPLSKSNKTRVIQFLRHAYQHGISSIRTADLAMAIAESGTGLLSWLVWPLANVHSTGAPGSLTTLLSPILVAASGFYVPQVSIMGGVAGAIDSLATIPGYDDGLSPENLKKVLEKTGFAHVGHTKAGYAFADRVLWDLRKDSGTKAVPCLIAASLLGKMLSVGVRHGVVDIRVGPSGNAGANIDAAFETAYAIVETGRLLGMRITCVLSDATTLHWETVGRIEAVCSIRRILDAPQSYASHPHIRLCILVAACACHAALPLKSLEAWTTDIGDAFRNGKAKKTFLDSITAHGASPCAFDELESLAAKRYQISLNLTGKKYTPDLKKLSSIFKSLREKIGGGKEDQVGLFVDVDHQTAIIYMPPGYEDLEECICHAFMDVLTDNEFSEPISLRILLYNGQILSDFSSVLSG